VAQFAYDGSQLLTLFEIKLNGADFFFFSKHVSSPEMSRKSSASPLLSYIIGAEDANNPASLSRCM
ncbi:TPA: hypothetical protein ACP40F_004503, partial [Escherichia coli]